jgi:RHS repeat-associated protein
MNQAAPCRACHDLTGWGAASGDGMGWQAANHPLRALPVSIQVGRPGRYSRLDQHYAANGCLPHPDDGREVRAAPTTIVSGYPLASGPVCPASLCLAGDAHQTGASGMHFRLETKAVRTGCGEKLVSSAVRWVHPAVMTNADEIGRASARPGRMANGEPLETGGFGSPFTFTGELLDANALLYLRARYYSPALGVFTTLDPIENGNRYQYVDANPTNRADPSGLQDRGFGDGDDYNAAECNQCWIDWYETQADPWGVPKSAIGVDYLLLAEMRREECLREHGCPGTAGYIETDITPFMGILGQVIAGAIRRRGTQAAAAALGDWVLPFGDIIGTGLVCLGAIETINDIRKARQHAKESTDDEWIKQIPFVRAGEGTWEEVVPGDPPQSCNDPRLSTIRKCERGAFYGFGDALRTLEQMVEEIPGISIGEFDETDWYPSEHEKACPGGLHWNIPGISNLPGENLVATILCCPCCSDLSGGGVSLEFNCYINPHSELAGF